MRITYFGHSCFRFKGSQKTVVADPFDKYIGYSMPKTKADVVTISHEHKDHAALDRIDGDPFVIRGPGEYEVGGVFVHGLSTWHDQNKGEKRGANTVYTISIDGFRLAHLGDLGESLSEKKRDEMNGIDVLLVPIGGIYTITAAEAIKLIEQIDPKIAIPMHYKTDKHTDAFKDLTTVDEFIKLWAREPLRLDTINLKEHTMEEETQLIVLTAKA